MCYRSDLFTIKIDKEFYHFRVYQRTEFSKIRLTLSDFEIGTFENIGELYLYTNDLFIKGENVTDIRIYGTLSNQIYIFYYDEFMY